VLGESNELVAIDASTLSWENLEYARLQVRSRLRCNIRVVKSVRINNHTCSILIEEETLESHGGLHLAKHNDIDSDSVSFSETYVEETTLSTKSCEEGEKLGFGEVFRPAGEEEGGETAVDGVQSSYKTKTPLMESSSKSKTCQKSAPNPFMNKESIGQKVAQGVDLDLNPTQGCAFSHHSVVAHAELAKAVLDIECSSMLREPAPSPTQVRELEAHLYEARVPLTAQVEMGVPEPGSTQMVSRQGHNGNDLCGCISEGKEVGVNEVDEVSGVGNSESAQAFLPLTVVNASKEDREAGGCLEGGTPEVVMSQMVGKKDASAEAD